MSTWLDDDVIVDGKCLHFTRTGGGKPALVLAHGFSDSGLCWLPVARDLEAEYDLVLPDARGHGHSARLQPGESLDLAADLAGLIRVLRLDRPVLGGHSMGASTSAEVEARFPGLVRALILEDPAWRDPDPVKVEEKFNPFEFWLKSLEGLNVEELIARCQADNPGWPQVEWRPWAESKKQFDMTTFQTKSVSQPDWPEVVSALGCPTLLITADPEKGAIVTPELAQKACALNGNLRVVRVTGAGHSIRRENYAAFMLAVGQFLKDVRA